MTVQRDPRHPLPRLTSRVFTDLGIWMIGLGVLIGLVFPGAVVLLGVPRDIAFQPGFFAATLAAGLMVGAINHRLARSVVGSRLRTLTDRMGHVTEVLGSTAGDDWEQRTLETLQLPTDSEDELGEGARSFNQLVEALAASRAVAARQETYLHTLAEHLDLDDLARVALEGLVAAAGAAGGALLVVGDGVLRPVASHRVDPTRLPGSDLVAQALRSSGPTLVELPADVEVDAGLLGFRPAAVAGLAVRFADVALGVVVLGFLRRPEPEQLRSVNQLLDPTGVALNNALTHERYQHLAAVDPLTGAYNRRFGMTRLQEELARSVRTGEPLGVLAFDLDHFKAVNDTYGHLLGDQVLRDVVLLAGRVLRTGDVLVRSGGEEFIVLLPGASSADTSVVAERLRRIVELTPTRTDEEQVGVTISIGALSYPATSADTPQQLLVRADQALYRSKHDGRNRVTVCDPDPVV